MKRTLTLRREALADLTPADLAAVRGAGFTVGDHCGPPFDTKVLTELTRQVAISDDWSQPTTG